MQMKGFTIFCTTLYIYCTQQSIPFHQCKHVGMDCWWWQHRPPLRGSACSSVGHGAGFPVQSMRPVEMALAASVHQHSHGTSMLCQLHITTVHSAAAMHAAMQTVKPTGWNTWKVSAGTDAVAILIGSRHLALHKCVFIAWMTGWQSQQFPSLLLVTSQTQSNSTKMELSWWV